LSTGFVRFKYIYNDARDYIYWISETFKFINMNSIFLQLFHEDGRTVMNTFIVFFPELPQTFTDFMYIVADWCYRETE